MNQNYNLMRLANLYGGMNKYAADDIPVGDPVGTMKGKGIPDYAPMVAELRKLPPAVALKVLQQNKGMFNSADYLGLVLLYTNAPNRAGYIAGEWAKLSPAERLDAYKRKAYGEPATFGEKLLHYGNEAWEWAKANPLIAGGIGAGALGLGGLGAYYAMKDDEEEQKKSASVDIPGTEFTSPNHPLFKDMSENPTSWIPNTVTLERKNTAGLNESEPLGYTFSNEELAMARLDEAIKKDPSLLEKIKEWIKANPGYSTAIGAGALGLGGLGAYYALKDDEEEQKKSASYIDPYVAQVLAHDYITKMAAANGVPSVAAGVTGLGNYTRMF